MINKYVVLVAIASFGFLESKEGFVVKKARAFSALMRKKVDKANSAVDEKISGIEFFGKYNEEGIEASNVGIRRAKALDKKLTGLVENFFNGRTFKNLERASEHFEHFSQGVYNVGSALNKHRDLVWLEDEKFKTEKKIAKIDALISRRQAKYQKEIDETCAARSNFDAKVADELLDSALNLFEDFLLKRAEVFEKLGLVSSEELASPEAALCYYESACTAFSDFLKSGQRLSAEMLFNMLLSDKKSSESQPLNNPVLESDDFKALINSAEELIARYNDSLQDRKDQEAAWYASLSAQSPEQAREVDSKGRPMFIRSSIIKGMNQIPALTKKKEALAIYLASINEELGTGIE